MKKLKEVDEGVEIPLEVGEITLHPGFDPQDLVKISIARSLMRIAEALEALKK